MKNSYFIAYLAFYILGAYATTDIPRLLKDSNFDTWDGACYCPKCNHRLHFTDQLPIISFLLSHGKCNYCSTAIPISNLIPEVCYFLFFSILATITHFSWISFFLIILIYESVKLFCICYYGPKTSHFCKNLICSVMQNIVLFALLAFIFLICQIS